MGFGRVRGECGEVDIRFVSYFRDEIDLRTMGLSVSHRVSRAEEVVYTVAKATLITGEQVSLPFARSELQIAEADMTGLAWLI